MIKKIFKFLSYIALFFIISGFFSYLTIHFIVKSEDTVVIPELVSKDVVYVLEMLGALDLNLKFQGAEFSSYIPKYQVISQDPEPGSVLKKGRNVRIIFSKGTEKILMPDIRGLNHMQAKIVLEENNLQIGHISRVSSTKFRKNHTINQYPNPFFQVKRNIKVDMLISEGQVLTKYKLFDLAGLSLDEAIFMIENNGFKTGKIETVRNYNKPQNSVINQNPSAGYYVNEGGIVDLVINRKIDKKDTNFSNTEGCKLFTYQLDHGFLKKHILIKLNIYGMTTEIMNDFKKPGELLWILIPGNKDATLFLYEDDELKITKVYDAFE
ncbi:MAG: PASTA domain-containing protein [Desulfobacterales bacterium]|nr:PASTA domain-containing protein [Desulfobacterales bacterium]